MSTTVLRDSKRKHFLWCSTILTSKIKTKHSFLSDPDGAQRVVRPFSTSGLFTASYAVTWATTLPRPPWEFRVACIVPRAIPRASHVLPVPPPGPVIYLSAVSSLEPVSKRGTDTATYRRFLPRSGCFYTVSPFIVITRPPLPGV